MAGVSVQEIQEEFADLDIEVTEEEVLLKLKDYCDKYCIDANKISCEYFSFNTKGGAGRAPTLDLLDQFEHDNLRHLKIAVRRPLDPIEGAENLPDPSEINNTPKKLSTMGKRNLTPDAPVNKRFVSAVGSPSVNLLNSSDLDTSATAPMSKYTERKNRGEVVLKNTPEGDWEPSANLTINITKDSSTLDKPYRYMFDSLRERAAVLDENICKKADALLEKHGISELMDIRTTQMEPQFAVGRVCCDSEGHLNSNSVVLQASMDTSSGATVPLDLSKLDSFSLFPGQIIGLEGTNPSGARLQVTKLFTDLGPALAPAPREDQVLKVLVSSGSYTLQHTESYQPLRDVLERIQETKPHVAIFMGPFVDSKNSALDQLNESYHTYFERMVKEIFATVETIQTQVILVPSQRDLHENPVYPQPAYNIGNPDIWEGKIHSMPDPSIININGVTIGVTSSDILFHLGKEEISFPLRSGDRLSRLANYLLSQSSFYPLYPPHLDQNVDMEHLEQHAMLPYCPHVMLTPSDLQYFIREQTDSTTFLNPGRITKGVGPGTYAELLIKTDAGKVSVKTEIKRI